MTTAAAQRRLAAILSADVADYSRLIAEDEAHTVRTLAAFRDQVGSLVGEHRGRLVDFSGDNFLAEFPTALDAVSCALETQRVLAARNAALPEPRRLQFRMGIHLGDVLVEGERVFGNGVNVAARLEALAEPGGVVISDTVRHEVAAKLGLALDDLGSRKLKNIPEPVRAFRVRAQGGARPKRRAPVALLAAGACIGLIGLALFATWPRPLGLLLDLSGLGRPLSNPALPDKPSLAVLPFQNMSNDPNQEYFSDGFTEDLTSDLSRMRGFFVISRNSAFTYKGKSVRVEQIGKELGVRYVVEGSVQKAGDRVRITAQLVDATNGHHVWSQRYDRALADVFALQSEIVDEIMAVLPRQIREAETQRARRKPPGDVSAYDAWLRGVAAFRPITRAGNAEARKWLERAVELDPGYADATAMLANTYTAEHMNLWSQDPALLVRARELGRRALELDPENSLANYSLGLSALAAGDAAEAVGWHERAVELDPNYFPGHLGLAIDLMRLDRLREAVAAAQNALRLDPLASGTRLVMAAAQLGVGRTAEAAAIAEQARAENPDSIAPRLMLVDIYTAQGRHDEARTLVAEIRAVNPQLTADDATLVVPPSRRETAVANLRRAGLP